MPRYPATYRELDPNADHALIHILLVSSLQLQYLPRWLIVGLYALGALAVALAWGPEQGLSAGGIAFGAALGLWGMLWLLPRAGRSFGPEIPPSFALTVVIVVLLIGLGLLRAPLAGAAALVLIIMALAFYSTWIEPFRLGVTRQRLIVPGWRGDPLRLLHISDLHVERITPRERQLNALIEQIQPDVIAFTGDFVNLTYNADPVAADQIRQVIDAWRARLGTFAVPGTPAVEPLERVQEFVAGMDHAELLLNRWAVIDCGDNRVAIAGMITTHELVVDRRTVAQLGMSAPAAAVRILLSHAPDVIPEAACAGFDLYLCGHTHGGQIRLPILGPLLTASQLGRRYAMGRVQTGRMISYTVRGVGMEGLGAPRARFLCPPEIVLWEIGAPPQS